MKQIIECVPNFSEGRDLAIIKQITDAIEAVEGVLLLDVDPGAATNRTVVTFAGEPEAVCEAAFQAMAMARKLIDMRRHKGAHPRFGATDVCPLVPVANITMEETALWAHKLAERAGRELDYPIYCYESAATRPDRKNLATVRAGEYEALPQRVTTDEWKPDYGPARFVPETGATAVGARDFLVAINFNLNTTSTRRANAVAFDVREAGRVLKTTNPDGTIAEVRQPGTLNACKAIGWYIEEYAIAQVSMNITNIGITTVHQAFEAVSESARARGMRVTGSEIVGLVPKRVLLEAGKFFLKKQQRSTGITEEELIMIAVKSMGLDDLKPFEPRKKVIEYLLERPGQEVLAAMSVKEFTAQTASEKPAPGGGSVAANLGALAAALGTMVANLSSHKRGWDDRWEQFSDWAEQGEMLRRQLVHYIDEDTRAFNGIMEAMGLPKGTPEEKTYRKDMMDKATLNAIEVPYKVMMLTAQTWPLLRAMVEEGNPNSVSDAGVGALCAKAAIWGAYMNVKINASGYDDRAGIEPLLAKAQELAQEALEQERTLVELTMQKIG